MISSSNKAAQLQILQQKCDEICSQDSKELRDGEDTQVFKKIAQLVNVRDRSSVELYDRLIKDYAESAVQDAIERAQRCGLLDDMRFAESLIRTRISANKGQYGIEAELKKHNIDPCQVKGWPFDFFTSDEAEIERALVILRRKPPTSKNKMDGAFRRIIQKGFSVPIASSAAKRWLQEIEINSQ